MIEILARSSEGYTCYIDPKQMGIHPKNRSGKKMQSKTMQKKGYKIVNVGFTTQLCGPDKAIAFENNPITNNVENHTMRLTADEHFATYVVGSIRAGSAGCSHLNQFIAAVKDGAKTYYADLCERGSDNISTSLVAGKNSELEKVISSGLQWFVIKYQIEDKYPELPLLVQRALNVEHHIGEGGHN